MGLFIEDLAVGREWTTRGRTIGEGDVHLFAGLVGDFTPIHVDEEFARKGPFGTRIAHGPLTMSVAIGLLAQMHILDESVLGLLGLQWDFAQPVLLGETIRAKVTVVEARRSSRPGAGVATFRFDVLKGDGVAVQRGTMTVLMKTRDHPTAPPEGTGLPEGAGLLEGALS